MSDAKGLPTRKHFSTACHTSLSMDIFFKEHFQGSFKSETNNYPNGHVKISINMAYEDKVFKHVATRDSLSLAMYELFLMFDMQLTYEHPLFIDPTLWKNL